MEGLIALLGRMKLSEVLQWKSVSLIGINPKSYSDYNEFSQAAKRSGL